MDEQLRVLIIDHSPAERINFAQALRADQTSAYEICEAADGRAGVEHARNSGKFDCVLLDYDLPGRDGVEISRELSLHDGHTPILMLTEQADERAAIEALKSGAKDYLRKEDALADGRLARAIKDAINHKRREITMVRRAQYDELTGLIRKEPFLDLLERSIARAQRTYCSVAVVFIDLDGMSAINNDHGHDAGDTLLQTMAVRLEAELREIDTAARLGGDEFGLMLDNLHSDGIAGCITVCNRLVESIVDAPFTLNGSAVTAPISIGVAIFPQNGQHSVELLDRAKEASRDAKQNGSHHVKFSAGDYAIFRGEWF